MRKIFLAFVVVFVLAATGRVHAAGYQELSLGSAEAPVTIIDYSSLTCPHCATFHNTTLPEIKKAYVDTGKVRIIFTDFPFEGVSFRAAVAVRCAAPSARQALLDLLFKTQAQWAASNDPVAAMLKTALLAGVSEAQFNTCFADKDLTEGILSRLQDAQKTHGINSTPTFLVDGEKVVGAKSFDDFKVIIDKALAKAGAQ
ncbi:thioredoxin domain-containing protein [Magnetospira sp. QH-2]|uniref:thioredoxin domain-containing protein n=1 Tax=Magnetospira sp. (strain QH-2) TaxID=1288970 RepID=UPI0003E812BD|nr:thioredoxin domain-containing protein [Magnetospira sp. QH-2]CCQ72663.1 putative periplasmic DSBA oxidoreductase [Magnetospira sp. QH-2]